MYHFFTIFGFKWKYLYVVNLKWHGTSILFVLVLVAD